MGRSLQSCIFIAQKEIEFCVAEHRYSVDRCYFKDLKLDIRIIVVESGDDLFEKVCTHDSGDSQLQDGFSILCKVMGFFGVACHLLQELLSDFFECPAFICIKT